ncbi:ABC transporter permease [Geomonas sp. Red69]|uniref:ABC transporter permease n=1 Tax=Geomonas diazotrophica TaxID=2843197 RepID=A0ABX8JNJ2_9BACT|nr:MULTISPECIES: ABC transporter permease [Geomonas]MBU5635584.1 ABC transporter permease [Geomonas diazotrophica]QWV98172.1 ABC transporter permease [Geomonas nitrogeniifigens]QXE87303.1 ABC transporter permease [Geomonas nitrogeniifigens]
MIEGIFVEGLIYGIMVLGVFISFRILDFPDLTVDGSFPLGAALMVQCLLSGMNGWLALLVAFAGGVLAGVVTALIHNHLRVPNLLAGILTMTMLYSVNIRILGNRANVPILDQSTILKQVTEKFTGVIPDEYILLVFFLIVALVVKVLLDLFFRTDLGMTLGAMGNNEQMVISQGVNPKTLKTIGVGLSNGLVAISGAFAAQYLGFADVGLGQGIIVSGLASVMIGEFLMLKSNRIGVLTFCALAGSVCFYAVMYVGRFYGYVIHMTPSDLNLIKGVLIIVLLIATQAKKLKVPFKVAK